MSEQSTDGRFLTPFKGRVYGITGGAAGIGWATARMLMQARARVLVVDCDAARLEQVAASEPGGGMSTLLADIANPDVPAGAVNRCLDLWGRVDGWVNNAMSSPRAPLGDLTEEQLARAFEVNLTAAWRFIRACTASFKDTGAIVNVSSILAHQATPFATAYSASKAALEGLTRALALELAPQRVRINLIVPGYIRTSSAEPAAAGERRSTEAVRRRQLQAAIAEEQVRHSQPWPDHGRPEDAAAAIVFLLSDAAAFITGTSLFVDGGLSVDIRNLTDTRRLAAANRIADLLRQIEDCDRQSAQVQSAGPSD